MLDPVNQALSAGRLGEAQALLGALVRQHPGDLKARVFLAELACCAGELERADRLLDAASSLAPDHALGIALFRRLLRGAQARADFYAHGRLPTFDGPPSPGLVKRLEAAVALRAGDPAAAATALAEAEGLRSPRPYVVDGRQVDDLRDLDDLLGDTIEILTHDGELKLLPLDRLQRLELEPVGRWRDRLWRPARLVVEGGSVSTVWLPLLYPEAFASPADEAARDARRLGQATDWAEPAPGLMLGCGLKLWLVGDEAVPLERLTVIEPARDRAVQT
jgi:type VI secretion system protein ImpE